MAIETVGCKVEDIHLSGVQGCLACAGQPCTPDKFFLLTLNESQIRRWIS